VPPAVARPTQVLPLPTVSTNPQMPQRPQPVLGSPPAVYGPTTVPPVAADAKSRVQPQIQPFGVTPNPPQGGVTGQGTVASPKPTPAPAPMRESRVAPSMPAPTAPASVPLAAPPTLRPAPAVPGPQALPGVPVAATPGGHPREVPKVEKPAVPAVHVPADVPAK
jgi:hypothetical protein